MAPSSHALIGPDGFQLRGTAMSRVDGFSDVVFGFALTLLVVSLEVPKTYGELHELIHGFLPFAVSFTLLLTVWYAHYFFFRRYGLHDVGTIVLNAMLLFVVLFYVYPLKFMFGLFIGQVAGYVDANQLKPHEGTELMVVYGLGFTVIYLLFFALYWNGWRQREELELTPLERKLTKIYMADHLTMVAIGLLSCLLAVVLPLGEAGNAGWVYLLIGVSKWFYGYYGGRTTRSFSSI
ncbi:TMEM175 family protein [Granulicella arctica]|uniref:TMEM175 family protein n=1 Tax=Granulicella arctica TaxID=940613 RepID=UPI0021E0AC82|nr:TMEM175 family protein [Granulicella arctica]